MLKSRNLLYLGIALLSLLASCGKQKQQPESDTAPFMPNTATDSCPNVDIIANSIADDSVTSEHLLANNVRMVQIASDIDKSTKDSISKLNKEFANSEKKDSVSYKNKLTKIRAESASAMKDSLKMLLIMPVTTAVTENVTTNPINGEDQSNMQLGLWKELSILEIILFVLVFILGGLLGFIIALLKTQKRKESPSKKINFKKIKSNSLEVKGDEKDFYDNLIKLRN